MHQMGRGMMDVLLQVVSAGAQVGYENGHRWGGLRDNFCMTVGLPGAFYTLGALLNTLAGLLSFQEGLYLTRIFFINILGTEGKFLHDSRVSQCCFIHSGHCSTP
jgi:hypothetical protein